MSTDVNELDGIERDLARTRSRLDATLDELQQKLSPGELMSQAVTYIKEGGGMEFGHNLGRSVRDNPIPVALIGIGLGWLVVANSRKAEPPTAWRDEPRTGGNGNTAGRYTGARVQHSAYAGSNHGSVAAHQSMPYQAAAYEDLATKAMEAGSRVERRAGETEDAFKERAGAAKAAVLGIARDAGEAASAFSERVEAALASATDRFKRMTEQAGAMASDAGHAAADMAGDLAGRGQAGLNTLYDYGEAAVGSVRDGADYAVAQTRDMGSRTATYLQDQPLLLGALGIALGAGLGLLLPASRYEREVVADMRRGLLDQADEAVRDVQFRAARVAESVINTAQATTEREGLTGVTPQGLAAAAREKVTDTAGRFRDVVEESAAAGREAVARELKAEPRHDARRVAG